MNILPNEPRKATAETIPSESDRSMFSCERYQFFLDAPFEICNNCCNIMKKNPSKDYQKKTGRVPITAQMASESRLRTQVWLKNGCNAFDAKKPISNPLSFWVEDDILYYIYLHGEEMVDTRKKAFEAAYPELTESELAKIYENGEWGAICSVYGEIVKENEVDGQLDLEDLGVFDMGRPLLKTTGAQRTGCVACGFHCHHETEKNSRWKNIIDRSNPKIADWILRGGHFNEDGLWEPHKGCGYWFIFEWCNKFGGMHYWYPNRDYYLKTYMTDETRRYLE